MFKRFSKMSNKKLAEIIRQGINLLEEMKEELEEDVYNRYAESIKLFLDCGERAIEESRFNF